MQLVVFVTVCICDVIDLFMYHMVFALIYIPVNLDVVFSVFFCYFISFLEAMSGCQSVSPSSAHYCHTRAYLEYTS